MFKRIRNLPLTCVDPSSSKSNSSIPDFPKSKGFNSNNRKGNCGRIQLAVMMGAQKFHLSLLNIKMIILVYYNISHHLIFVFFDQ